LKLTGKGTFMAHQTARNTAAAAHGGVGNDSRMVFFGMFAVFLLIALLGAVLGGHWRTWLPGAEGVKSVTGGVKAAVYTVMSHLP
jgi:light-harvesting complex 1 beta chain